MKNKKMFDQITRLSFVLATGLLLSSNASAVNTKPHKFGGTEVNAVITSALGYGDNVFRGSENETSSTFFSFKPIVEAIRETADQKLTFGYEGDGVAFFGNSDDNYLSNKINGDYVRKLNAVSEFSIGAGFEDGSTIRGIDITQGTNGNVEGATDFTRKDFSLGYLVGSEKIGPSIELSYDYTDLAFDNFQLINRGRDYKLDTLSARFGYQYSVATKFFIDLSYSDFDYDVGARFLGAELDGSEQALLVGIKWRLNRLTSGEISIGTIDKEFDNFKDPGSLTTWRAQIVWTPTARDTVSIESFSRPFEQAGTGLFQDVEQTSFKWEHDVSKVIGLVAGATFGSVDFDTVVRNDDYNSVNVGLLYKPNRYSEWSFTYEREDKDSNLSLFDFETNTVFLSYSISI